MCVHTSSSGGLPSKIADIGSHWTPRLLAGGHATESSGHVQSSKREAKEVWMMKHLKKLEDDVSTWPNISVHPHRFGGREFRFGSAEVGHIHAGGIVDIPFPRSVHDVLLAEGLAEEHRWVPNSGWITDSMPEVFLAAAADTKCPSGRRNL